MREPVYRLVVRTALALFRILDFRFDMRGTDNIPEAGGAVLASNHVSYFDFMFVGLAARHRRRRLVRFMAKNAVFEHWLSGPLMRAMRHIPVDRSAGAAAYRHAVEALRSGQLVGVFPESTISRSFVPRPIKAGAARMALEAGVPLLPVVAWGGHRVWTTGRRPTLRRHVPVIVRVGEPLEPAPGETAADLTVRLAATLREMVDDVVRDYPGRATPGDDWWLPANAGGSAPTPEQARIAEDEAAARRRAS
jgi:1-acyl-sn-glycerol-3-phosphate acyltransferase